MMSGTVTVFLVVIFIAELAQKSQTTDENEILTDNETVRANTIMLDPRSKYP